MNLIIISGPSATGKTTLAQKLSQSLKICWLGKDLIKESLFDSLGWSDREWSKKMDSTAYFMMFEIAKNNLAQNNSLILESDFEQKDFGKYFNELKTKFQPKIIQIITQGDPEVLFDRFQERVQNGQRHPGHNDKLILNEIKIRLESKLDYSLDNQASMINLDATDFANIDHEKIIAQTKNLIQTF